MHHPKPWKIAYNQRFPEWHPQSQPRIVDANGDTVCEMPQTGNHPGDFDAAAVEAAQVIVSAVNATLPTYTATIRAEHNTLLNDRSLWIARDESGNWRAYAELTEELTGWDLAERLFHADEIVECGRTNPDGETVVKIIDYHQLSQQEKPPIVCAECGYECTTNDTEKAARANWTGISNAQFNRQRNGSYRWEILGTCPSCME